MTILNQILCDNCGKKEDRVYDRMIRQSVSPAGWRSVDRKDLCESCFKRYEDHCDSFFNKGVCI